MKKIVCQGEDYPSAGSGFRFAQKACSWWIPGRIIFRAKYTQLRISTLPTKNGKGIDTVAITPPKIGPIIMPIL